MKKHILLLALFPLVASAITGGKVWRVPDAETLPKWGTVSTLGIADSAVTTAKIANSNVTTAKIADANVTTAKINDGAVTPEKLAALGQQISSSISDTETGTSFVEVASASVTITATGRPILLFVVSNGSGLSGISCNSSTGNIGGVFRLVRGLSTEIAQQGFNFAGLASPGATYTFFLPFSFVHVDVPSAGATTYTIQFKKLNGTDVAISNMKLVAIPL